MLRLLPVSEREEFGRPLDPLPWEPSKKHHQATQAGLWRRLLRGGFPELVAEPDRDTLTWSATCDRFVKWGT